MKENVLEKADCAYWSGQPTGISDTIYDKLSEEAGHICQPPRTLKGWANYPDYPLLKPNYGLKKVSYEIAKNAVRYWPKWDGIFCQVFKDEKGIHFVTRGDGQIGKDLKKLFYDFEGPDVWADYKSIINCELCYRLEDGGRAVLCADISKGRFRFEWWRQTHNSEGTQQIGHPPKEIPTDWNGWPIDGWVIELESGEKFKYKG